MGSCAHFRLRNFLTIALTVGKHEKVTQMKLVEHFEWKVAYFKPIAAFSGKIFSKRFAKICRVFLEIRAYEHHYSVVKGYFRFKKLWRNHYITRYRVVELRFLLGNIIICLYKYVDLASKFLIKIHTRKEPPSYQ